MSDRSQTSPADDLSQMITGYWVSQCVYVAAKLGLADLLANGPRTAAELAEATASQTDPLYRVLRALASVGVFAEDDAGRFALTPLAERLRSDVPGSQRAFAIMMGEEQYHVWGDLIDAVQTGRNAFQRIYHMPIFEFLQRNPEKGKTFDAAMVGIHGRETGALADAYDFSGIRTLADVGGGNGSLLRGILERNPSLQGILYDLPAVVERARPAIEGAGLAERCRTVAGNFFESVPAGADAYIMRHIIHDWDDAECLTILGHCRAAMPADGRLLVVESIIPPGNEPCVGKLLDLTMLLMPGGRERTEEQYRALFASAGFELVRVVPTATEVSVLESRPV
ncbi:MAG: methyltransferase [Planctomycetaceae bacterium]